RPVLTDRLALALPHAQRIDHSGAKQEHKEQRRDDRAAGPKGKVAEDIEDRKSVCELLQEIEHGTWSVPSSALKARPMKNYSAPNRSRIRAANVPSLTPFDPLSITESPAASAPITSSAISSTACDRPATSPD